jgi:hypothetical protein
MEQNGPLVAVEEEFLYPINDFVSAKKTPQTRLQSSSTIEDWLESLAANYPRSLFSVCWVFLLYSYVMVNRGSWYF